MGEGGDRAAKVGSHSASVVGGNVHGDKAGLVEVNGKPCSKGELVENRFEARSGPWFCPADDESVVCILKDRTGGGRGERVRELAINIRLTDEALEDIGNNDEEIGSPWRRPLRHLIQSPGTPLRSTAVCPV